MEWLIDSLMHSDERLRKRAGEELKHLTREDFGYHPEGRKKEREAAQKQYRAWWQRVGFRMFLEWENGDSGQGL